MSVCRVSKQERKQKKWQSNRGRPSSSILFRAEPRCVLHNLSLLEGISGELGLVTIILAYVPFVNKRLSCTMKSPWRTGSKI